MSNSNSLLMSLLFQMSHLVSPHSHQIAHVLHLWLLGFSSPVWSVTLLDSLKCSPPLMTLLIDLESEKYP